jgi:hypothetical protein
MASSPRAAAKARGWKEEDMEFVMRKNFTAETQRPQRVAELGFGVLL